MATLARQENTVRASYSLTRDNQFHAQLETAFGELFGSGVLTGGAVTATTGFGISIAAGSKFFGEGVVLELASAQAYTANAPSSTVYVWGKVLRTAATSGQPATEDSYSLEVTHNTTGTAPSSLHFPLAILTTDATGVTAVNNTPDGKYLPLPGKRVPYRKITTAVTLDDTDHVVAVDAAGGAVTVMLPTAASRPGKLYVVKKVDASTNVVTVDGDGTETIDGAASSSLASQWNTVTVVSDGANWLTL